MTTSLESGANDVESKRGGFKRPAYFFLTLCVIPYLVVEIIYNGLYFAGIVEPASYLILEESEKTIHFDPILGYRLTSTPSRFARITRGEREFLGTLVGNSQGFPDHDDFSPLRGDSDRPRIAVCGDSFSAAAFLEHNWPDVVEQIAQERGAPVELLNF